MDAKQAARDALIKRALGYSVNEKVEEYAVIDGEVSLVKKKVNSKDVPPEINAIKLILEQEDEDYSGFSEDELIKERDRLIGILIEKNKKAKQIKKGN